MPSQYSQHRSLSSNELNQTTNIGSFMNKPGKNQTTLPTSKSSQNINNSVAHWNQVIENENQQQRYNFRATRYNQPLLSRHSHSEMSTRPRSRSVGSDVRTLFSNAGVSSDHVDAPQGYQSLFNQSESLLGKISPLYQNQARKLIDEQRLQTAGAQAAASLAASGDSQNRSMPNLNPSNANSNEFGYSYKSAADQPSQDSMKDYNRRSSKKSNNKKGKGGVGGCNPGSNSQVGNRPRRDDDEHCKRYKANPVFYGRNNPSGPSSGTSEANRSGKLLF